MSHFFTFSKGGIRISHEEEIHEVQWDTFDPDNEEVGPRWVWGSLRGAIEFFKNPRIG